MLLVLTYVGKEHKSFITFFPCEVFKTVYKNE